MILMTSQEQQNLVLYTRVLSNEQYGQRTTLLEPGHREEERYGFFDALLDWLDVSSGGNAFWGVANQVTIDESAAR